MLTHCTLAHCTLGPLNYVKAPAVCAAGARSHWRGIWLSPLLSLSCVLSFAVHATLYPTRYACDPWPSGVLYGSSVVPPYATFYISPFIVVQLTLNLTINPKPLTDPQVILFSLDASFVHVHVVGI